MNYKPKVVLDANILLSALVYGGKPRAIIDLFASDNIWVVFTEEILTETRRTIVQKFPDFCSEFEQMQLMLQRDGQKVFLGTETIEVCRDPDDNRVIEAAVIGKCTHIISGDKDLLVLERYDGIQILNASDFINQTL